MSDHGAPSGPRGLPLLGSAPDFRRDPLGFFTLLARQWGDVVGFRLGVLSCCLVSRPDLISEVFERHDDDMRKPWDERQLGVALGHGLLTGSGDRWRRQRRLVEPAFRGERLREHGVVMARVAGRAAERWRAGQEIDVHAELQRITMAIVGRTLFGVDLSAQATEAVRAFAILTDRFERLLTAWLPIPLSARTPGNARLRAAVRSLDAVAADVVARRRAEGGGGDLLGDLLTARDGPDGGPVDREIREIVITLLAAGHETTALAVTWALHLLGGDPACDRSLVEEADAVGRPATDARSLPYARRVVREALRLYPPAWGIGREAGRAIELDGRRIAKGTQVYVSPWVTHRDPRWFPDPARFDPGRWEAPGAEAARAWIPFGAGPRACVGSGFAMLEAPVVLAELVRRWRFVPVADHPVELQPAITLRPRHGILMRIERR